MRCIKHVRFGLWDYCNQKECTSIILHYVMDLTLYNKKQPFKVKSINLSFIITTALICVMALRLI